MLSSFYWNPDRIFFTIPYINHPIAWYGIFFALGFFVGYFVLVSIFRQEIIDHPKIVDSKYANIDPKSLAQLIVDKLAWYVVIGAVVGARLGHILFYDWAYYSSHPEAIFRIWEGGLASHGGGIGLAIAILLFHRKIKEILPGLSLLRLFDLFCIPVPFACGCIRIGNFINQEIVGTPSDLPWAVKFGNPMDGLANVPLHPVQLYEAIGYFAIFLVLMILWKYKRNDLKPGLILGFMLTVTFACRFFLEFFKFPQGAVIDESVLQMGQWLSIPGILIGLVIMFVSYRLNSVKAV